MLVNGYYILNSWLSIQSWNNLILLFYRDDRLQGFSFGLCLNLFATQHKRKVGVVFICIEG